MPPDTHDELGDLETPAISEPAHLELIQQRIHNDRQSVNKLPAELLSQIFTISVALDRNARPRTVRSIAFPEVITVRGLQVCNQWRGVAIGCQTLWTHIHITRPSLYRLVSLYLDRAGASSLLDIDIEMRSRFWKAVAVNPSDWETQLHKVPYVLKFLASRGATVDRWRSLTVCAKQPEVLYAIIGFINAKPARALQFISFKWKLGHQDFPTELREELRSTRYPHLYGESYSFSPSTIPKLRSVEFKGVPWEYVFKALDSPRWTGLKSLTLTSAYIPCSAGDLQKLLTFNPELEQLSLGIPKRSASTFFATVDPDPSIFRVRLSNLRSLSFSADGSIDWVVSILPVIEAPELRILSIAGDFKSLLPSVNLFRHVVGGGLPLQSEDSIASDEATKAPYPLLDELDISRLKMLTDLLKHMLSLLPTITKLHISSRHAKQLNPVPQVLPNLAHIFCSQVSRRRLKVLARSYRDAGLPITLHLDGPKENIRLLPENVKFMEYHRNDGHESDGDDSEPDDNAGLGEDERSIESRGPPRPRAHLAPQQEGYTSGGRPTTFARPLVSTTPYDRVGRWRGVKLVRRALMAPIRLILSCMHLSPTDSDRRQ